MRTEWVKAQQRGEWRGGGELSRPAGERFGTAVCPGLHRPGRHLASREHCGREHEEAAKERWGGARVSNLD